MRSKWLAVVATLACGAPSGGGADAGDEAIRIKVPPAMDGGEAEAPFDGPTHLEGTGLYADFSSRSLAAGVITYTPRYPLWQDGLVQKRYLLLPPSTQIDTSAIDDWLFPIGTKVWKELDLGGAAIETRFLWKITDDEWWAVSYVWTPDGTDAVAAPNGSANVLGTTHDVPSRDDCESCHDDVRDMLIGVSTLQLGASDGDGTLTKLANVGALTKPPAQAFYDVPGTGATKEALGYLHGNCGSCHADFGMLRTQTQMRLRLYTTDTDPNLAPALVTSLCLFMKHEIPPDGLTYTLVPGQPDRSGMPVRMARRDAFAMPPIATKVVDDAGVATVRAWIASLNGSAGCP